MSKFYAYPLRSAQKIEFSIHDQMFYRRTGVGRMVSVISQGTKIEKGTKLRSHDSPPKGRIFNDDVDLSAFPNS
jgi:hypothetical protein